MKWILKFIDAWTMEVVPEEKPEKESNQYKHCAVEHYPLAGRYYPTYKGKYLYRWFATGLYELQETMARAEQGATEADAWKIMDRYLEQKDKVNVRVLTR